MAQLMPLPLTVSCFVKIQVGFTFLVLAHLAVFPFGALTNNNVDRITGQVDCRNHVPISLNFLLELADEENEAVTGSPHLYKRFIKIFFLLLLLV